MLEVPSAEAGCGWIFVAVRERLTIFECSCIVGSLEDPHEKGLVGSPHSPGCHCGEEMVQLEEKSLYTVGRPIRPYLISRTQYVKGANIPTV